MEQPFVSTLLPGLRYYDRFITQQTERQLLADLHSHPRQWKNLNNRTLQNWGGLPHIKGMLVTPLPSFLDSICEQLVSHSVFPSAAPPNHVLVNRYLPSQGIDRHVDGPAYKPLAAIISLQSPIVMDFYTISAEALSCDTPTASLILRPRSLLIIADDVYHNFYHAIAQRDADVLDRSVINCQAGESGQTLQRRERISLTIRRSCKTIKNPLKARST